MRERPISDAQLSGTRKRVSSIDFFPQNSSNSKGKFSRDTISATPASLLERDEIKWSKCVLDPTRASSPTIVMASCSFIYFPRVTFSILDTRALKDTVETPLPRTAGLALPYSSTHIRMRTHMYATM